MIKKLLKSDADFLLLTDCGVNEKPKKYPCVACSWYNSKGDLKYTYVYLTDFEY